MKQIILHHHDEFREYKKLVDFPNIIHACCAEKHKDTCDLTLSRIFESIEFSHALYPKAIEVHQYLKTLGKVVLFTEGDTIYQKRKIQKSGLAVFADEVLLFEHKWEHFAEVVKQYDGRKIVLIDDRAEPLVNSKHQFLHIFTIEVCQGHYALTLPQFCLKLLQTYVVILACPESLPAGRQGFRYCGKRSWMRSPPAGGSLTRMTKTNTKWGNLSLNIP